MMTSLSVSFLYLATNSRYDTPFVVLILANQENALFFFSLPICDYKVLPNVFRISTVSVQFTFRNTHPQSVSKVTQFPAKTGIQQVDSILFWSCLCILSLSCHELSDSVVPNFVPRVSLLCLPLSLEQRPWLRLVT